MAKKYQAIETKVHWITWTSIILVLVTIFTLLIVIQPSDKEVFYSKYQAINAMNPDFSKKLPEENKYQLVSTLEDEWFGLQKGVYSYASRTDHVTVVFFGHPENQNSGTHIANAYVRLYGSSKVSPVIEPSKLYQGLGDEKVSIFYYEVRPTHFTELVDSLNDHFEDAGISAADIPLVVAFLDNEVLAYDVLSGEDVANILRDFYNEVFAHEKVEALIQG